MIYTQEQIQWRLTKLTKRLKEKPLWPKMVISNENFFYRYSHFCGVSSGGAAYDVIMATFPVGRDRQIYGLNKTLKK